MANRRQVLAAMLSGLAGQRATATVEVFHSSADPAVFRLAFGSCLSQRKDQNVLSTILDHEPHAFVMMGDGVYPEHEGAELPVLAQLEAAYAQVATLKALAAFRDKVKVMAIWDDNDFGGSDIGASFQHKCRSKELFLNFWANKEERQVRNRASGIYGVWEFGSEVRRIQVIVPDLRYCRSEWAQSEASYIEALRASGFGPYARNDDPGVTMLGEVQWQWLEECLRRPARVRVLVSSIQCVPEGRGWESWSNFPAEKARLLKLIRDSNADGLVLISGDSHYAELSRLDHSVVGYPLWEVTSSGLTETWPTPGPNPHRIGDAYPQTNFGVIHVNWVAQNPMLVVEIFSATGKRLRQQAIVLDSLSAGT